MTGCALLAAFLALGTKPIAGALAPLGHLAPLATLIVLAVGGAALYGATLLAGFKALRIPLRR